MNDHIGFLQQYLGNWVPWLYNQSGWWTVVGFLGNGIFGSRFFFQWLESERKKRLVVPNYFWQLSFWGSLLNLIYAFHIDRAPLILGVIFLPVIYGRNLVLLKKRTMGAA